MRSNINIISANITILLISPFLLCFFSIHTYTQVQFEKLHKYIKKRNKIYKKWYTEKQSLDIKLFGISRKQKKVSKKKQKRDVSSKRIDSFIIVVVMTCRESRIY